MTAALDPAGVPARDHRRRCGRAASRLLQEPIRQHVAAGRGRDDVAFAHRAAAAGGDRVAVRGRRLGGVLVAVTSSAAIESFKVTLTISICGGGDQPVLRAVGGLGPDS